MTANGNDQGGVVAMALSPDGQTLLVSGIDGGRSSADEIFPLSAGTLQAGPATLMRDSSGNPIIRQFPAPQSLAITPAQYSPAVTFSGSVAKAGQTSTFTAPTPAGLPGMSFSYSWNFGDGATASGQSVSHVYGAAGNYNVTLTITPRSPSGSAVDMPGQTPYWNASPGSATGTAVVQTTTNTSTNTTNTTTNTTNNTTTTTTNNEGVPGTPTLTLNPAVGPPGTIVTVTGSGFPSNSPVTVTWSVSSGSFAEMTDGSGDLPAHWLYILSPDILGPRYAIASSSPQATAPFLVVPDTAKPGGDSGSFLFRSEGP
jgi:hypothetical protein